MEAGDVPAKAPPEFKDDDERLLAELGYSTAEIAGLHSCHAV